MIITLLNIAWKYMQICYIKIPSGLKSSLYIVQWQSRAIYYLQMLYKIGVNSKNTRPEFIFLLRPVGPQNQHYGGWSLQRRETQPFRKGENSVSQKFVSPLLTRGWGHNSSTVLTIISMGHCQLKAALLDSTNFPCVSHSNTPIPPPILCTCRLKNYICLSIQ